MIMTSDALFDGSIALPLRLQVTRAVHRHGFLPVLRLAIIAWIDRPRIPPGLSDRLRADMGLPPDPEQGFWPPLSINPRMPPPLWRPGL